MKNFKQFLALLKNKVFWMLVRFLVTGAVLVNKIHSHWFLLAIAVLAGIAPPLIGRAWRISRLPLSQKRALRTRNARLSVGLMSVLAAIVALLLHVSVWIVLSLLAAVGIGMAAQWYGQRPLSTKRAARMRWNRRVTLIIIGSVLIAGIITYVRIRNG